MSASLSPNQSNLTLEFRGFQLPARALNMPDEHTTYVSCDYLDRSFRFCIRGASLPFEVSFLHEYDAPDQQPAAWFVIAPEAAADPMVLQQYVYPQLIDIHRRYLREQMLPACVVEHHQVAALGSPRER